MLCAGMASSVVGAAALFAAIASQHTPKESINIDPATLTLRLYLSTFSIKRAI
jgi:hypothetical protein